MIKQVAAAIERRDYSQASRLLKPLLKEQPHNPWLQLYAGQIHEAYKRSEQAQAIYRRLLQTTNQQVIQQAQQGLRRLTSTLTSAEGRAALEASKGAFAKSTSADPASRSPRSQLTTAAEALLVLQPTAEASREQAIAAFSQLAGIDRYTARTQLPVRGWRLHHVGELEPLGRYWQQLQQANIPAQLLPLQDILNIHVFRVKAFQQLQSPTVLCENEAGQLGNLAFTWQEVAQCVEGRLPIFEEVVDRDARKRLMRKQKTQDYAYLFDLHLPQRRSILRLCDQTYRFSPSTRSAPNQSMDLGMTRRRQWQALRQTLSNHFEGQVWTDFIPFAESALDPVGTLPTFDPHIEILRKRKTPWDKAFHIYSSLVFCQPTEDFRS